MHENCCDVSDNKQEEERKDNQSFNKYNIENDQSKKNQNNLLPPIFQPGSAIKNEKAADGFDISPRSDKSSNHDNSEL